MVKEYSPENLTNFYNAVDSVFDRTEDVSIIFDIGSLHSLESIEFSKKYKNAKIFAFEANPESYQVCLNNTKKYQNINVINTCVNTYDGECEFYPINPKETITTWFDGNRGASSMFKSNGAADKIEKYVQNKITIPCRRLDSFCLEKNIEKIDCIWMDLQGAELIALESLGDYLNSVKVIQTELEVNPIYENQCLFEEVNEFLLKKGFSLIHGNKYVTFGGDFVYVKK